jgi:hypothetical protein
MWDVGCEEGRGRGIVHRGEIANCELRNANFGLPMWDMRSEMWDVTGNSNGLKSSFPRRRESRYGAQ